MKHKKNVQYVRKIILNGLIMIFFALIAIKFSEARNCTSVEDCINQGCVKALYTWNNNSYDDTTPNGYDLSGSGCTVTPAKYGNGCEFDGVNDRTKNITLGTSLNRSDALCVGFWFNNTDAANGYNHVIFPQILAEDKTWGAFAINNQAGDALYIADTGNGASQNYISYTTYTDTLYVQYHIVYCSGPNGDIHYWINNVYQGYDNSPIATAPAINGFVIGGKEDFGTNAKVKLDELWVFNCQINNDVINDLYEGHEYVFCSPSLANTSLTLHSCKIDDTANQSYVTYDANYCGTIQNTTHFIYTNSCNYCDYHENLSICELTDLEDDEMILAMVLLWIGLWIFGYYCLQTKNELLGGTMIMLTLPIDLYFSYQFQESLMLASGLLGIAFAVMTAWTIGIFMLIRRSVRKSV